MFDSDPDSNISNRQRTMELEKHIKILEAYKKEASSCILLLEEENLKLKGEVLSAKEEVEKVKKAGHVAGRWRIAALKDKQKKEAVKRIINRVNSSKDASNNSLKNSRSMSGNKSSELFAEESADVQTPIQNITRTVGRLTKVSELLDVADLRNVLSGVVASLSSQNLYAPSRNILDKLELDETTKQYILSSFTDADQEPEPIEESNALNANRQSSMRDAMSLQVDMQAIEKIRQESRYNRIITSLEYDVWSLEYNQMEALITLMFANLGLIEEFSVPINTLSNLIKALKENYYNNPYHNFQHAFDVAQMCYILITQSNVKNFLTASDKFSLLVAALCHDLCHPGTNNTFQVNASTELALLYNDQSVLENYHCSKGFSLMRQEHCNILQNLSKVVYKEVRKSIISAILATDMTVHFELASKFTTHIETRQEAVSKGEPMFSKDIKDRQLLMNILLHSADISNMVRPPEISRKWADLVFKEFLTQVMLFISYRNVTVLLGRQRTRTGITHLTLHEST